jgi:hypothetical protein
MKRTFVCGALLTSVFANPASAAFTMWQGDLYIKSVVNVVAGACTAVNMQVGDFARFEFRPKNVGTNGATDLLSWTFSRSAGQVAPTGGSLDLATLATVRFISGSAGFTQVPNSPISATVTPSAPTAANTTIPITITINNIYSGSAASNCNATFSGVVVKRP